MCCIYNDSIKNQIKNTLRLKENECEIEKDDNTYIIRPKIGGRELYIDSIETIQDNDNIGIHLFQLCNLSFERCIFRCEVSPSGISTNNTKGDETFLINKRITFNNCVFQKSFHCSSITMLQGIIFQNTTFESAVSFINVKFNSIAQFSECDFQKEVNFFDSVFLEILELKNSIFHYVNMKSIHFKREANFSNCKFQNEVDFSNSTFYEKANFKEAIFKASAYFDNATFRSNADFERSEFCENAHFYQTEFSQNPNFFQTTFNEHLNLTDTKIHNEDPNIADMPIFNFDFEGLKGEVQTCSEADKFRDVFKNIKNALIKSGNLLGASRFRKMELYCKEIELDLKKKENRETSTRDFVDRIQLYCYRLTSDHHTDLLLILNNVIILIACFGAINFAFNLLSNNYFKVNSLTIGHAIGALIACSIFAILAICLIMGCCKKLLDYFNSNIDNIRLFLSKALPHKEQDTTCPRACVVFFSYITTAIILVVKPALLVPIFGQMIDSKSSIGFAFASLNIIYAILMFLLIFSLQKTARKNTIVPN